jgi:hypothetical protein
MRCLTLALVLAITVGCGQAPQPGEKGEKGEPGLGVTSNKYISGSATTLCTQFTGEECRFLGGQLVTFGDGTVYLSAEFTRTYVATGDTDMESNSNSVIIPPGSDMVVVHLSEQVSRGSGPRNAWLAYVKSLNQVYVLYDTDGDGRAETSDTVILTPTLADWTQ